MNYLLFVHCNYKHTIRDGVHRCEVDSNESHQERRKVNIRIEVEDQIARSRKNLFVNII